MLHSRIEVHGRIVDQITSEEGQKQYYDNILRDRQPRKNGNADRYCLVSPDGTLLLPEKFVDVSTQFEASKHYLKFVPVSNGDGWGLVSLSIPHIMATDFIYNAVITERFEHSIYFVQDKKTLKWGALVVKYPSINAECSKRRSSLSRIDIPAITELMPPIADEIYEDELMTDCSPTLFWMTRVGNKIGILTPHGYSKIIYDAYETLDNEYLFRLTRNECKRVKLQDYSFLKYNS